MKKIIVLISIILLFWCENTQKEVIENTKNLEKKEVKIEEKKEIKAFSWSIEFKSEKIDKLWFFKEAFSDLWDYVERDTSYHNLWKISLENRKSWDLILARSVVVSNIRLLYFVNFEGKYYYIPSISIEKEIKNIKKTLIKDNVILDEEKYFLDILKDKYDLKNEVNFSRNWKDYVLELIWSSGVFFDSRYLQKIDNLDWEFYIEKKNNVYWDENFQKLEKLKFHDLSNLPESEQSLFYEQNYIYNYFKSNAIFYKMPDWTMALYNLKIPFWKKIDDWEIKYEFTDKNGKTQVLEDNYSYSETASCWVKKWTFMYVIDWEYHFLWNGIVSDLLDANKISKEDARNRREYDEKVSFKEIDLWVIWKMWESEIYSFKDKNHKFLKAMYKYLYINKLDMHWCYSKEIECSNVKIWNYDEFVENMPLFFYKDPFWRNVMFLSWSLSEPSACWAKPVIYLYPKQKTDIKVSLDWDFKNLITYPKYLKIWDVESDEFSNIVDKKTGIKYDYLFWEDLLKYKVPDEGFVIEKWKLDSFFDEKLAYLWLNSKEINEFKKYWLPQMQKNNFYFINFLNTKQMDKIAPITINPKPDNILRVFMNFKWLDDFIEFKEQKLERFNRKWFYVVEWGGRKE